MTKIVIVFLFFLHFVSIYCYNLIFFIFFRFVMKGYYLIHYFSHLAEFCLRQPLLGKEIARYFICMKHEIKDKG